MFEVPKLRLDVASLNLNDERINQIATIIAEETEAQRELKRIEFPDATSESPNRLAGLLGGAYSYANTLRWDLLLTFGGCAYRCATRARMSVVELLDTAREHCIPTDPWLLFWYSTALKALMDGANAEKQVAIASKALAEVELKQQRIKEGARVGGQKSAERRREIQRTPPGPTLRAERERLIKQGTMDARNVASHLARKYDVSAAAIRAALKRN